jgi:uncharacterized membrane protein
MATAKQAVLSDVSAATPRVRRIGISDLRDALAKGLDDFRAMPTHSLFLIVIYPIVGLILLRFTFGYAMLPVIFPLVAGFALIGPLAALGLYELSRRRELGLGPSWDALKAFHLSRVGAIALLGAVLMVIFIAWLIAAMMIYWDIFRDWAPLSFKDFIHNIFETPSGQKLILVGCGVGFVFALVAFAISVVSFPLLVDRNISVGSAVLTSVKAVARNPLTMALWGLIVAAALVLGSLPILVGLAVVLPVLGHATWHLYRKVVEH